MEQAPTFEAHVAGLMHRAGPILGFAAAAAALVWWPLDLYLFADHPRTLHAFAVFRGGVVVLCLGSALLLPRFGWVLRRAALVITGVIAAVLGWTAYWMASTDDAGWNSLAFLYLAPFATLMVVVPLRQRALGVAGVTGAVALGWFLNPESSLTPLATFITLSYLLFAAGGAIVIGHASWVLLRTNFEQRATLDAQRLELEDAARDLTRRVADRTEALHQMRRLAQAAREDERRALGRDLHDGLGQELVAMRLAVTLARQGAREAAEAVRDALDHADAQAVAAQAALRAVLADFRAALLDELGLVPAVEALAGEAAAAGALAVEVDAGGLDGDVGAEVAITLFRVTQEALNNVVRHAGASRVEIALTGTDEAIALRVTDDGVGLREDAEQAHRRFGLAGMRERVELLQGELSLSSGSAGGLTVRAELPRRGAS